MTEKPGVYIVLNYDRVGWVSVNLSMLRQVLCIRSADVGYARAILVGVRFICLFN